MRLLSCSGTYVSDWRCSSWHASRHWLYFIINIDDAEIAKRSRKHLLIETVLFLVFFLVFLVHLLLADGFAVDPETKEVGMQPYKYFMNLVEMPAVSAVLLAGVAGVSVWHCPYDLLSGTWCWAFRFCGTGIGTHGAGAAALRRLEQYGLLSFWQPTCKVR
ncbi:MAG: hypothetical protein ACLRS8_04410 [Parabacteroides merdae]